jgi:hypothetical protein
MTKDLKDMKNEGIRCCLDCQDLGFKNIKHNCHCHKKEPELPNLGNLIDSKVSGVFYIKTIIGQLVGLKIMFDNGVELSIKTTEVNIARRI